MFDDELVDGRILALALNGLQKLSNSNSDELCHSILVTPLG